MIQIRYKMKKFVKKSIFSRIEDLHYKITPLKLSHIVNRKERRGARVDKLILCPLRGSLFKSGPVRFGSKNRFLPNFAQESTLV